MLIYDLKDGRRLKVRWAVETDAEEIKSFMDKTGGESDNLTFGVDEFYFNEGELKVFLEEINVRENCLIAVALIDNRIVGCLSFVENQGLRMKHRGELGLVILKEYWGNGIGTCLMDYFSKWIYSKKSIKKVELYVREDNINAIDLYIKWGFKIEGRIQRGFLISGRYYDIYMMGKNIE